MKHKKDSQKVIEQTKNNFTPSMKSDTNNNKYEKIIGEFELALDWIMYLIILIAILITYIAYLTSGNHVYVNNKRVVDGWNKAIDGWNATLPSLKICENEKWELEKAYYNVTGNIWRGSY